MKIVKSARSEDKSAVERDIENARVRMISENPSDYADWRLRMGLQKPTEPRVDPAMRARVNVLFAEPSRSLEARNLTRRAPIWRDMTPAEAADKLAGLPERFSAPISISTPGLRAQACGISGGCGILMTVQQIAQSYTNIDDQILRGVLDRDDIDTIYLQRSFVTEDSELDVARALQANIPGSRLKGVGGIIVTWSTGGAQIRKKGSTSVERYKGIMDVSILSLPSEAIELMELLTAKYKQRKSSSLMLWYSGKDGPSCSELLMESCGDYYHEFYPWVSEGYFSNYLKSSASILFLIGPPGTGKTSLLRHEFTSRAMDVAATYDEDVVRQDAMFLSFITSSTLNVMVIEDADNLLMSRERERNGMISRFLNFSEGLAKFPQKKIIFTTNLSDFSNVDEALVRPGRCFGTLHARALTRGEALIAADKIGVELPRYQESYLLADIFNEGGGAKPKARKLGFV